VGKVGSPEKPLSDLGYQTYMAFWKYKVAAHLLDVRARTRVGIDEIATQTAIRPEDVIEALQALGVLLRRRSDGALIVSKESVRNWATANGINLAPLIDADSVL